MKMNSREQEALSTFHRFYGGNRNAEFRMDAVGQMVRICDVTHFPEPFWCRQVNLRIRVYWFNRFLVSIGVQVVSLPADVTLRVWGKLLERCSHLPWIFVTTLEQIALLTLCHLQQIWGNVNSVSSD